MQPLSFLIVHTFGLGDMIMATPALELLFKQYPTAQFDYFVGYPPVADIVRAHPQTRNIFVKNTGFNIARQIYELRQQHYDYVLVTSGHSAWKSGLFAKLLNAGCTIGDYGGTINFFDKGFKRANNRHRVACNLFMVKQTFAIRDSAPERPRLTTLRPPSGDDAEIIKEISSGTDKILIGIHCGSRETQSYKRWPTEHFREVLTEISQNYGNAMFLIFATGTEQQEAQAIADQFTHCSRIILDKPLGVVAELLQRCRLMIANDSGIGHLAAAVGTPTLSLFGPSDPGKCAPLGAHCRHIKAEGFCTPCIDAEVPAKCRETAECLSALKPGAVYKIVAGILDNHSDTGETAR